MKKPVTIVPMFVIDRTGDTRVLFAREDQTKSGKVAETLCEFRVPSGTLLAFTVWLGENKRLWHRWWSLGAAEGSETVGCHIKKLWSDRLADRLESFDVDIHTDRSGVSFVGEYADRTALIAVHRFSCVDHMEVFIESYHEASQDTLGAIFATACLAPPHHLSKLIASIVDAARSDGRIGRSPPIQPTSH